MSIDFYNKNVRHAVSARIKPGQSACRMDALTTTPSAPFVMIFFNIGVIEVVLHDTQVPDSCRKWHNIYVLVLIHSQLYMSNTSLRWVVNVRLYPPVLMQIEVWAVSNLTFVLLSFAIQHTPNDSSSVQSVGTLKHINGDDTTAVCRLRKFVSEALHAIPNCLWIHEMLVRNAMKQNL